MPDHTQSRTRSLDDTEATDDYGTNLERHSKSRRIRLACLRCQKRKIKCDGSIPKCGGCQKANAECVDGKKTGNDGGISRTEAAFLHRYIENLEATLRDNQPHVNLTSLRTSEYTSMPTSGAQNVPRNNDISSPPQEAVDTVVEPRVNSHSDIVTNNNMGTQGRLQATERATTEGDIAHDIGLVPLSAGVNKYVGPSSGFALTKVIFNRARRDTDLASSLRTNSPIIESPSTTMSRTMLTIQPGSLPTSIHQAIHLSRTYFEYVHIQYPFLHEPTFFDLLRMTYESAEHASKWAKFQITMVLAISASILAKRLPIPFSGESLCALAMRDLEKIDVQSSLEGLQCLLLVYMFTLHSPFLTVSPWYLNYQFLAAILDLGLQRDLSLSTTITEYDREMRTRIFWVVYTIDRTLATTLGRPIGLRDEGCDLRQPRGIEDHYLHNPALQNVQKDLPITIQTGSMSCAKTLFRLARLNSEIKYILHSVNKEVPAYTYPQIPDIAVWQEDFWGRLQECNANAPKFDDDRRYMTVLCSIRYHEVAMHLFRPTPHIRNPTESNLIRCHSSAEKTIEFWKELYEADKMSYSWITVHSVCLSALTILYCIWTSQVIADSVRVDQFSSVMSDTSALLGAAGEYWAEARRSRTRLDNLARATTRWLTDKLRRTSTHDIGGQWRRTSRNSVATVDPVPGLNQGTITAMPQGVPDLGHAPMHDSVSRSQSLNGSSYDQHIPSMSNVGFDEYINNQDLASFLGAPDSFTMDRDFLMEGMFVDYQPLFDFNGADPGCVWSV